MPILDQNKPIMRFFEDITKIPHGSYNEKELSDYIEEFAKERNLTYKRDDMHNIIIYKSGINGLENSKPVILQGHIDMVNEKNNDSTHDFTKDALKLYIEDGWLSAEGTTLGADDGIAVAYMLAILDDTTIKHPPLECIFTVQEEVGLFGAANIKKEDLSAKRMIGMDSGSEGVTSVSSSGGRRTILTKEVTFESNTNPCYQLKLSGLLGGHSGGSIHLERGNANKLAFRMLLNLLKHDVDIQIINVTGGLKENAIPRECNVIFSSSRSLKTISRYLEEIYAKISEELEFSDPNFCYELESYPNCDKAISSQVSKKLIQLVYLSPNGFKARSLAIEGLTTVSLNLGVIRLEEAKLCCYFSIRSPMKAAIEELSTQIDVLAELFNASVIHTADYPGWNYDPNSELRKVLADVTFEMFDRELVEHAGHGGLETGIFKGLIPELDIVTLCAITKDIHTPDERLNLESFEKMYDFLVTVLARL